MRKITSGFTIVELIIVIAIMGVLSTIGVITYNSVQIDARDSQRAENIKAISEAIEKYYDKNGEYPSCPAVTSAPNTVTNSTLKGLNSSILTAPTANSGTNSLVCDDLANSTGDSYAYLGTGVNCSIAGGNCLTYTLQYRDESDGSIISISGRRSADALTLANPSFGSITSTATTITVNWNSVSKAQAYSISISSNSNMSSPTTTSGLTTLSKTFSGLAQGSRYYFQVVASATGFTSGTSTVTNKLTTVNTPAVPGMTAAISGSNAVGTTGAVSSCTTSGTTAWYQMQYNTSDGAWSTLTGWSTTPPSQSVAANEGSKHGFQAHAKCVSAAGVESSVSGYGTATVIRPIATPAGPTWVSPSHMHSLVYARIYWDDHCPAGTSVTSNTFRSNALDYDVAYGPHPWGFNDSWEYTYNVGYWGKYKCYSAYYTSPYSPETYKHIDVYH